MKESLESGEILCPKCNGTGAVDGNFHSPAPVCDRCWGAGKLDWIDLIMGKPNPHRTLKGNWTIKTYKDIKAFHSIDLEDEMVSILAKELAEEIDKEIMEKLCGESNKI
jgi:DnaJ-class molecular chaperone